MRGFGGIGGLLRYQMDLSAMNGDDDAEDEFFSDDDESN